MKQSTSLPTELVFVLINQASLLFTTAHSDYLRVERRASDNLDNLNRSFLTLVAIGGSTFG